MAEEAWLNWMMPRIEEQVETHEHMDFVVNRNDHVRVGQGYIEFIFGKHSERMNAEDIAASSIKSGTFSVKHQDASWLGSRGEFSFSCAIMDDAPLFPIALNAFVGPRFQ